jgi:hypothetical protein
MLVQIQNTKLEIKYLLGIRKELLSNLDVAIVRYKNKSLKVINLKKEIKEVKESVMNSRPYQEEERVTYQKKMIKEATEDLREQLEVEEHLKRAKELDLTLVKEKLYLNKEEIELCK